MADPMRDEELTLRDGRRVRLRPGGTADAESTLRNVNRVGEEEVYIMIEEVPNLEEERRWLSAFDGVRNVLFVAVADGEVIGAADCHAGAFRKDRHVGGVGISIQDGWREVGLGRRMMERVLEWMRVRGYASPLRRSLVGSDRERHLRAHDWRHVRGAGHAAAEC